jgi:hypothetical protein
MSNTVTNADTAELVAHHLVASSPKNNNAPRVNIIQLVQNLERVAPQLH